MDTKNDVRAPIGVVAEDKVNAGDRLRQRLAEILDDAYRAEDNDWRVFRGPYHNKSSSAAVMAWRGNAGLSYVELVGGRNFEFKSWTDSESGLKYVLVRRGRGSEED